MTRAEFSAAVKERLSTLTEKDRWPVEEGEHAPSMELLDVCQALHGEVCGTGAGNHLWDELVTMTAWLMWRREHWTPSVLERSKPYDAAVLALVDATLAECLEYWCEAAPQ